MQIKNSAYHGIDSKRKVMYRNFHDVNGVIYLCEISRNTKKVFIILFPNFEIPELFIMEVMSEKIFTKLLSDKNYMYDILIGESFSIKYGKLLIRNYNHGVGSDPRKRSVQPAAPGDLRFYDSNSISNQGTHRL